MSISLILLGAGNSTRFDMSVKKQWLRVGDEPLWLYVAKRFISLQKFDKIVIVGSHDELNYMRKFADFEFCAGGETRQESLKNALKKIKTKHVLVSDIARACVDEETIENIIFKKNEADVIVPYLEMVDTVHHDLSSIDRKSLKRIQTPQLSRTKVLKKALANEKEFTDDSSAIVENGGSVAYVKSNENAHKITCIEDLQKLSCIKAPSKDFFVGSGFDVHAFGEKRALVLGGVKIDESMGLKAHSDGDVLIHALIDALLGAIGFGDIGELFPDTDTKFKNADSYELLEKVVSFVRKFGYEIVNSDITVLAQKPKISPFKIQIAKHLAKALQIKPFRVNVKATTTEKLGFVGRSEGISVMASVNVKFYDWKRK